MSEELTHSEMQKIGEEVVAVLCTIFDPEIPVDIYQLGLIYDVKVSTLLFVLKSFLFPCQKQEQEYPLNLKIHLHVLNF